MLLADIRADLLSHIDPAHHHGLGYWVRVIGKAIVAPSIHVVIAFRVSHALAGHVVTRPLAFVLRSWAVVWGGTEIHPDARIGPGLCLVHSQKVIIGGGAEIGAHARICQGVTISGDVGRGSRGGRTGSPVLGDHVTIGADAILMGPIRIGHGVVVGAQSLVVDDVPDGQTVVGSPARVLKSTPMPPLPPGGSA